MLTIIQNVYSVMRNNILLYNMSMSVVFLASTFIATNIINLILDKIEKKMEDIRYTSFIALLLTIKAPLQIFIWSTCIYKILTLTLTLTNNNLFFLHEMRIVLITIIALWLMFRFISKYAIIVIEQKEKNKENIDYGGIDFIKKLTQVSVFFVSILFCLGKLGVNFQSLMAIGGAGGLAIGFAAKDLLSNIFAALTIYIDKPFTVGDWIASPDRQIEGDVEEIGWRQTRILTFSKYPIYVANSVFTGIIIENKTRMKSRRISEIIPIRYIDISKIEKITKEIKEMLKNNSNINQRLITIVALDSVKDNATLNLKLYTFANTIEWLRYTEIKQDVLIKVTKIIQENGGELAYGVQEIVMKKERGPTIIKVENSDIF